MDKPDQLRELWRMQDALNKRIGVNTGGMNDEEKTKWLLNYSRAMTQEIAELTGWSVPLVKVRAFRARAEMRKALARLTKEKYL